MPAWVQEGYREYEKRLPRELKPVLNELALAPRSKNTTADEAKKIEAEYILSAIDPRSTVIALDLTGKFLSTQKLSTEMAHWQMEGKDVSILIGGPDGFAPEVLQRANVRWSLSDLTLPHPLVRIVLIEQLYRAWTILQNHPYHK